MASDSYSDPADDAAGQGGSGHTLVTGEDAATRSLTADQLVAVNMARARRLRGLTQVELGRRLTRITGREWSQVTVSAAERSPEGGRVRLFPAGDLLALGEALDLPAAYFLLPPEDFEGDVVQPGAADRAGLTRSALADRVLGSRDPDPHYLARLRDFGRAALVGQAADALDAREAARQVSEELQDRIEELAGIAGLLDRLSRHEERSG